ncbi:copper homeostasis protein CutC [Pontibacter diazotrophicus]|uniref:PF03932 family protein CutC n=1 Tax=Pontibacter diazotrophicus TaxID=1400979 RepID=A0A3D8LIH0_9BACT|nr:copper homeostasis protein CutC [Pontibacter diazotrophicus]RDV17241.1 copper homeostasis protein CutC [Pontibacter diazotrophicus]
MERASSDQQPALEVCIDTVASAMAAEEGGAQRVELCDYLAGGGTTPSAGMIKVVRKSIRIGLHVLIRPRRGDFLYSDAEFEVMKSDIAMCRELGADGVVIGVLNKDGSIDTARTQELIAHAGPLSITFHRAFDLTPNPLKALDALLQLNVHRLLTSGQQETALQGIGLIRELNKRAAGKLIVMPGGGVNPSNIRELVAETGVSEVHASVRKPVESKMNFRKAYPPMSSNRSLSEFEQLVADVSQVRAMRKAFKIKPS